jgi:hypothetical protein
MGALGEEYERNELAVTTPQKERSLWETGLQKTSADAMRAWRSS